MSEKKYEMTVIGTTAEVSFKNEYTDDRPSIQKVIVCAENNDARIEFSAAPDEGFRINDIVMVAVEGTPL
jgi:hypothetical protein